ncbi:MAG: TPM domain-containing protein, partial [Burkholderiaceae bacterium]
MAEPPSAFARPLSTWLRHLWLDGADSRRQLPAEALQRLEAAVRASEARHLGELRICVEAGLSLARLWRGQSPRQRAIECFGLLRVWDTEHNNGVLIYLLLADHDVEIVADRGIHARVGAEAWERVCREMEAAFRAGRFEEGALAGIRAVGVLLAQHFPGTGANEIPD